MNLVSRAFFAAVLMGILIASSGQAQRYDRIPDSFKPESSMQYVPMLDVRTDAGAVSHSQYAPSYFAPAPGDPGEAVLVGTMINGYTSSGIHSNQLGYDWVNNVVTIIFRAGPRESYPNAGNGSLVLNTTYDGGITWTGNTAIFNEDLQSNIQGSELSARHPNLYSMNVEGTTTVAGLWPNPYATLTTPTGVYGEIAHKAGPIGGPYTKGVLNKDNILQFFPGKITSDMNGTLYSFFQSIDPISDRLTGEFFILKSTDNGATWSFDHTNPCLTESELVDDYQIYYSSVSVDVSPDGSTLYLAFLGISVSENNTFSFIDNRFGYVRSTDGGNTWSDPVMYPLYTWDLGLTPVDILEGFMYPSIGLVVDGLNQAHFMVSVFGNDKFYPLDSMLIGELTVNPEDQTESPSFYALVSNTLPDFRRKVNPAGATGAQPTFTIWAEHEWSKTPDGMTLVAKWIDADSVFVTTPAGHPEAVVRDSTHDIYICAKDINNVNNGANGWRINPNNNQHDILNVTQSVGIDEKFTKMNPRINPALNKTYFIYTIMATGEFRPGQIYPDTDDQGPAQLFFVPFNRLVSGIGNGPDGLPEGFTLSQNYPNPFNPVTTITFNIPRAANTTIRVYNMLGQLVANAYDSFTESGSHAVNFNAENLSSGQYIYRLEADGYTLSKMMTLMK